MALRADDVLYWSPRVLGIGLVGLLVLLSADTFTGSSIFGLLTALMLHLAPAGLAVLLLLIAWRWEWFGAVAFPLLGTLYVAAFWGRFPTSTYLLTAGPLFVIGVLFLGDWLYRQRVVRRQ